MNCKVVLAHWVQADATHRKCFFVGEVFARCVRPKSPTSTMSLYRAPFR
jgi:hypothetical protein